MASMSRTTHARGRATPHDRLEGLFGEQQALFQTRLHALRDTGRAVTSDVRDAEEESVDAIDLGVTLKVLELSSQTVRGMEAALGRLKAGTLGRCADCGTRIPPRRLEAVRFAERCRDCQLVFQDGWAPPDARHRRRASV